MRTLLLLVLYVIIVILLIPFLFFCIIFRLRNPLLAVGKWAMGLGRVILGIKVEVSGIEKIDGKSSFIFMANHLSFLDGPLLFHLIPQPVRVILKKEIFKIPVVGLAMKHAGFVPVDRKGLKAGKESLDTASRLMKEKGYSFLIFPEGTRSRNGKLQNFRRGGFFLAVESGAPIIPVSIGGTFDLMRKGQFFVRKGKVRVIFHEPAQVSGYDRKSMPELMDKVREVVRSGIDE